MDDPTNRLLSHLEHDNARLREQLARLRVERDDLTRAVMLQREAATALWATVAQIADAVDQDEERTLNAADNVGLKRMLDMYAARMKEADAACDIGLAASKE